MPETQLWTIRASPRAGEFSVAVVRRLTRPLSFAQKVGVAQFANETVGRPCGPRVSLVMASVNAGDLWSKLACEQCFDDSYERCVRHGVQGLRIFLNTEAMSLSGHDLRQRCRPLCQIRLQVVLGSSYEWWGCSCSMDTATIDYH